VSAELIKPAPGAILSGVLNMYEPETDKFPDFGDWNAEWLKSFVERHNKQPHKGTLTKRYNIWKRLVVDLHGPVHPDKISFLLRTAYWLVNFKDLVYSDNPFYKYIKKSD
jgi:hypothetical protein